MCVNWHSLQTWGRVPSSWGQCVLGTSCSSFPKGLITWENSSFALQVPSCGLQEGERGHLHPTSSFILAQHRAPGNG